MENCGNVSKRVLHQQNGIGNLGPRTLFVVGDPSNPFLVFKGLTLSFLNEATNSEREF
ncbi:MAG: hypothetical protein CM15mP62_17030 [Rhodospirillaceae bacterium]|nr:MAG: hypothetical protein CM15mP62_17030 [Rhodospirillaceae bacterium]